MSRTWSLCLASGTIWGRFIVTGKLGRGAGRRYTHTRIQARSRQNQQFAQTCESCRVRALCKSNKAFQCPPVVHLPCSWESSSRAVSHSFCFQMAWSAVCLASLHTNQSGTGADRAVLDDSDTAVQNLPGGSGNHRPPAIPGSEQPDLTVRPQTDTLPEPALLIMGQL